MRNEEYDRAREIVRHFYLLDVDAEEKQGWIEAECEGDLALASLVAALIEEHWPATGRTMTWVDDKREFAEEMAYTEPGVELAGRYIVEKHLGSGGMATVVSARDQEQDGRLVAIKMVRGGGRSERNYLALQKEAEILSSLDHPNIVGMIDTLTLPDGRLAILLEYLPSMPVNHYVRTQSPSIGEVLDLFSDACNAVGYVHSKRFLHRDLKPENILVASPEVGEATAKVIDFGLALSFDELGGADTLRFAGTPPFASPEVLFGQGGRLGVGMDVYGLGATLYSLLTGVDPYHMYAREGGEATLDELARRVLAGDAVPASWVNPDVPGRLSSLLAASMAFDPADRPTSVPQLREAAAGLVVERVADRRLVRHEDRIEEAAEQVVRATLAEEEVTEAVARPTSVPAPRRRPRIVRVFYATDRMRRWKLRRYLGGSTQYAGKPDPRGRLHYGLCKVKIPSGHAIGRMEGDGFRLRFRPNLRKDIVLLDVDELEQDDFFDRLQYSGGCYGDTAFVFVHGYNVSFDKAALRTAQIAYDLKFIGPPILYSWPSRAHWWMYPHDERNNRDSAFQLRDFLAQLVRRAGVTTIHMIAHSMGSRALADALTALQDSDFSAEFPSFGQLVFAAPDVDSEILRKQSGSIAKRSRRATLYASSRDRALFASRLFHGYPRAGESGDNLLITDGVDTVDATRVDTSLLGHSYYGSKRTVLGDLGEIIHEEKHPDHRDEIDPRGIGSRQYWEFRK